jgi:single-strand DNA-binding protein
VFDTNIVVVGNVMTVPEWRRTTNGGHMVAHFRMASTSRRFDKDTGQWVDGKQLRIRVTSWRRLAENVVACLAVGDPVVVAGRLFTEDWTDAENNNRISYEMEAVAVGHDLARGRSRFYRTKPSGPITEVEAAGAEAYVRGEAAEPVPDSEAPARYGEGVPDEPEPQLPPVVELTGELGELGEEDEPPSVAESGRSQSRRAPRRRAEPAMAG